jgi:arylsulfatase A-like enzyme
MPNCVAHSRILIAACRAVLLCVAVVATPVAVATMPATAAAPSATLPNLLLVTIDTMRYDRLGVNGHGNDTSPHMDAAARAGMRFSDAFSTYTHTLPSMYSMFAGVNPTLHGKFRCTWEKFDGFNLDDHAGLSGLLQAQGYETAFVSNHLGLDNALSRRKDWNFTQVFTASTEQITNVAKGWLEQPHAKPVFLWVHWLGPHYPCQPPEPYKSRFVPAGYANQEFVSWYHEIGCTPMGMNPLAARCVENRHDELTYVNAQYDGAVAQVDDGFQVLLESLRAISSERKFAVAISSDHGESLGERGLFYHGNDPFESQSRIPLILYGPGIVPAGVEIGQQVANMDVMPTLLTMAGVAVPEGLDAVNLLGYASNPGQLSDRMLVSGGSFVEATDSFTFAVRTKAGKLMAHWNGTSVYQREWYDYRADALELNNLIERQPPEMAGPAALAAAIEKRMKGETPSQAPAQPLDEETERQLKALGYLD